MIRGYNKNLLALFVALVFILAVLLFSRYRVWAQGGLQKTGHFCSPDNPGMCAPS